MSRPFGQTRAILGRPLVWGLSAAVGLTFAALMPLARERQDRALRAEPDLLTLSYLRLALERAPEDHGLRLRLAERTLAAGQFEQARDMLEPLFASSAHPHPDAEMLRAEIDYRAWAAAPLHQERARQDARERLEQTLQGIDAARLSTLQAERVARFCAETGLVARRAEIQARLARAELGNDARLAAADSAHLEAGNPLAAARLHAERAFAYPERDGARHAALALRRALAAGQPGEAVLIWRRLRPRYGSEPEVLELALGVLAGIDDVEALGIARALLAAHPRDEALARRIADLTRWTASASGRRVGASPTPALPEPPLRWSVELPGTAEMPPVTEAEALELASLLESLGAPERALRALDAAAARGLLSEQASWDLRLGIQLRLGDKRGALATLAQIEERFGRTRQSVERQVDLLLALGHTDAALRLLHDASAGDGSARDASASDASAADETESARRISAVAWELGDVERVRAAYRVIAYSGEATPDDVRRLWLLEREAGDFRASTRAALAGLSRFADPEFSRLALDSALGSRDDHLVRSVLGETENVLGGLARDADQLRLHVTLRHGRAHQAIRQRDMDAARRELAASARLLALAERHEGELGSAFTELEAAQQKQLFELAVQSDDRQLLARTYPGQAERLSARERVFVLSRLDRDSEAIGAAAAAIRSEDIAPDEAAALQDEASALSADMPRQILVLGDVLEMEGLTALRAGAGVSYSFDGGERAGARVELTRLASWEGPSVFLSGRDELAAELSAGVAASDLALGVVAHDGAAFRPFARFSQGLHASDAATVTLLARVNDRSQGSAALRVNGVEDELAAQAHFNAADAWSAFARASAQAYSDRDRDYLGAGVTLDGWVGRHWALPNGAGRLLGRVATIVAPRFAEDAAAQLPDGMAWAGVGMSFNRGRLSAAPVAGRRLSLLADVTAGWLVPVDELGWSGKLGVGVSVLGADQLSIAGSASNVLGPAPGFAVYTLAADYALSQW